MRRSIMTVVLVALALAGSPVLAEVIDGFSWADEVFEYSANIQSYGGELLGPSTEWWLTGPPDADVDGDGYAWGMGDQDTVAGWRSAAPDEYITMYWEAGIPDLLGDDLFIHLYSGPGAGAAVFASVDGAGFDLVGTIGGGTAGYLRSEAFDFDGLFETDVHYVKVVRTASGPQTGLFFDAFGGNVPEPGSILLLSLAALGLRRRHA